METMMIMAMKKVMMIMAMKATTTTMTTTVITGRPRPVTTLKHMRLMTNIPTRRTVRAQDTCGWET